MASLLSDASLFCLSARWDANSLTRLIKSSSVKKDARRMGRKFAVRISSRRPVSKDLINDVMSFELEVHRSGFRSLILCLQSLLCYASLAHGEETAVLSL